MLIQKLSFKDAKQCNMSGTLYAEYCTHFQRYLSYTNKFIPN